MKWSIPNLILAVPVVVVSMLALHCTLPSDPNDPEKTSVNVVFMTADSIVHSNSVVETVRRQLNIGAALYLPNNFDSISLVVRENDVVIIDTTFRKFKTADYLKDTVWYSCTFSTPGVKNLTLTPYSTPGLQPVSSNISIVEGPAIISTITFLKNSSAASGTMPILSYTEGDSVRLIENSFVNYGYSFSGWATTETGPVVFRNKAEFKMGTANIALYAVWVDKNSAALVPTVVHAPSQLIAGKSDTILFAVDDADSLLTISLITNPPLDPSVFSIVPTGRDSILIAIAKSAGPTTATIGIVTSNGTRSDTSRYPITLISSDAALWNTTTLNLNAVEGSLFKLDLSQYLSATNGTGVSLSADIGTIDKTNWSYTPKWGCAAKLPATITAKKGDVTLELSLNLTVAAGDTTKPQISLVDPSLDGKKVSSSQITVECKATDVGAGVDSVIFTWGTQKIKGTLQSVDIYSGVIDGLVYNTPTQITITATDKSRLKKSATLTFTVTRDSTILDAEPPVIVKADGPENGARVNDAKGSLTFTVTDNAGVDSVWWTLNDAFVAVVPALGENKYTISYTFSDYGKNVIKLFAKDKSGDANKGSQTITLNYNTEVSAVTPSGPGNEVTGVSLTPSFTWTGGADADGDSVFYRVLYGTSATALSQKTGVLTSKTVTLGSTEQLTPKTTYYWRVAAWSKVFPDSAQSEIVSFTTLDPTAEDKIGPQIAQTNGPVDGERVTEATGTITVSVTDPNSVTSVTAKLNNGTAKTLIAGAGNVYTYSYTLSAFGENKVTITAVDGSANNNSSEKIISFNYNIKPTAVTLTAPVANATGVSTSPTFKWSGGDDEDGDGITYTVAYGISQASLTETAAVNGKTAIPGSPLAYAKSYYWQVTATSASTAYPDKVQSAAGAFTTEGSLPTISAQPQPLSAEEGQSVTFSVTAGGFGTLSYQWRLNSGAITGATNATYTISPVTMSMNNNIYDCIVKNEVGSDTSIAAKLTVTAIPSYTVNFVTDDGTPKPGTQTVKRGGLVTKPPTDPVRNGYKFTGWYELNTSHEFYFTTATITANLTIYAGWNTIDYTITYNLNDGTNGSNPVTYKITDATFTLKDPTKDGSTFGGWYSDQGFSTRATSIPAGSTGNKVFYAKWTKSTYTITLNPNGGTIYNSSSTRNVEVESMSELPTPVYYSQYDCLTFGGWYTSATGGQSVTTLDKDQTIYAHWNTKQFTVTFGGQSFDSRYMVSSVVVDCGTDTIPSPFKNDGSNFIFQSSTSNLLSNGFIGVIWPDGAQLMYAYYTNDNLQFPITSNVTVNLQIYGMGGAIPWELQ